LDGIPKTSEPLARAAEPQLNIDWPRWLLPTEANERRQFTSRLADAVQAIFCRRRHQPRSPPLTKIRPGSPAPATGDETSPRARARAPTERGSERGPWGLGGTPELGRSSTPGKQTDGKKRILVIAITSRAETSVLTTWSSTGRIHGAFDNVMGQTQPP
jgi:hypothetical protein